MSSTKDEPPMGIWGSRRRESLNGHSDSMGGVVVGIREAMERIFHFREIDGASPHPGSAHFLFSADIENAGDILADFRRALWKL